MEEKPLSYTVITLMVALAVFFDGTQFLLNFIPVLGQILNFFVDIFAFLSFYVWFKTYGITFMTRTRSIAMGGAWIIEVIPILNDLPAWTAAVLIVIGTTKGVEVIAKVSGSKLVRFASILGTKMPGQNKVIENIRPNMAAGQMSGSKLGEVNTTIKSHPAYSRENKQIQKDNLKNNNSQKKDDLVDGEKNVKKENNRSENVLDLTKNKNQINNFRKNTQ